MNAVQGVAINPSVLVGTTGVAAQLGVTIYDQNGGATGARVSTGIIESPTGSGAYKVTGSNLLAPLVAGNYTLAWDQASSFIAEDDLSVASTANGFYGTVAAFEGGYSAVVYFGPEGSPNGSLAANPGVFVMAADGSVFIKATGNGSAGWVEVV